MFSRIAGSGVHIGVTYIIVHVAADTYSYQLLDVTGSAVWCQVHGFACVDEAVTAAKRYISLRDWSEGYDEKNKYHSG